MEGGDALIKRKEGENLGQIWPVAGPGEQTSQESSSEEVATKRVLAASLGSKAQRE